MSQQALAHPEVSQNGGRSGKGKKKLPQRGSSAQVDKNTCERQPNAQVVTPFFTVNGGRRAQLPPRRMANTLSEIPPKGSRKGYRRLMKKS